MFIDLREKEKHRLAVSSMTEGAWFRGMEPETFWCTDGAPTN